jgi:hypothetical protein
MKLGGLSRGEGLAVAGPLQGDAANARDSLQCPHENSRGQ